LMRTTAPVVRECEFAGSLELAGVLEMVPMAKALGQLRFLGDSTYRTACSGTYAQRRLVPFVKSTLRRVYAREVDERRAR
jgi:hypothetical protein